MCRESVLCLLQEYLSSKDVSEARHCLRKLAVPFFHHEVVKQALLRCMEEEEESSIGDSLVRLLKELASTGDISHSQMARVSPQLAVPYVAKLTPSVNLRPTVGCALCGLVEHCWLG